jgi:outer membrane protein assembly complex protein YaeT
MISQVFLRRTRLVPLLAWLSIASAPALAAAPASSSPTIAALTIDGAKEIPAAELLKLLPFSVGSPLPQDAERSARSAIEGAYHDRGYIEASALAVVDVTPSTAAVTIRVREGPLYRFGAVKVEGLQALPEETVRREVTWSPGAPFDRRELFKTQSRLYSLGLFKELRIHASTTTARTADVRIEAEEQPLKWIKGGVGYGSEEQQRLSLIFTHNNFLGQGYKLDLSGTRSAIWTEGKAEFLNRYFLGTKTEERGVASWRDETRVGYSVRTALAQASLGRQLFLGVRGAVTLRVEQTYVYNVDPNIQATTPDTALTKGVQLTFNRDTADDPFFPRLGSRTHLLLERDGGAFGGDIDMNKALLETTRYQPLWGSLVAALTGRVGAISSFGSQTDAPIYDRFFTGGANTVRGYRERFVGPKDSSGSPLGGDWLAGASSELRFPIYWRLSGAAFIDGGQVASTSAGVAPSEWKFGAGAGIRFRTPIGPFRLDYGRKLNPDAGDTSLWQIHLSLGEAF